MKCIGFAQDTDMSSAQRLKDIPAGAQYALLQAEAANIRWRADGNAPTTTVGHLLQAGQEILFEGDLNNIQIIEVNTSAIANISYFDVG